MLKKFMRWIAGLRRKPEFTSVKLSPPIYPLPSTHRFVGLGGSGNSIMVADLDAFQKAVDDDKLSPPPLVATDDKGKMVLPGGVIFDPPRPIPGAWKLECPGGLVLDSEELKQFQKEHPEYCHQKDNPRPPSYTVKAHSSGAVGISLHGAKDPGPDALLKQLSEEDETK